jgi:ATP-dependent Clp protease ATP-binding subunit ClpA
VLGTGRDRRRGVDPPANCRKSKPSWGTSAKLGLERAVKEAKRSGDTKIGTEHILAACSAAEHGTVPRILAAEGIDRAELTGRL